MKQKFLGLVVALCLAGGIAHAHHGWSSYDMNNSLALSGTVAEISFRYPHATLILQTAEKNWTVVLAPPSRMSTRGLSPGSIKVGDTVSVQGYPSRRDGNQMRVTQLTLNGRSYALR